MNNYKVLATPLTAPNIYGQEIDISEYISSVGIGNISREVDNGDYEIGIFRYGDVSIVADNSRGKFNGPDDWRTFFKHSRDLAKIKIYFVDQDSIERLVFTGIVQEDGTETDYTENTVTLIVTSLDSIIRKTTVSAGALATGILFSTAIKTILNTPKITSVLNYSPTNINVGLDLAIDDGSAFDEIPSKEVIDKLLAASNSIMYVDSSYNIIVRSRSLAGTSPDIILYANDFFGRDNIVAISNLNSGLHRTFNIIKVNNLAKKQTNYITEYGSRQLDLEFTFITDSAKEDSIAAAILDEMKAPKIELEVVTDTETADGLEIYDQAQVIIMPRYQPVEDKLSMYGTFKYSEKIYPFENIGAKIDTTAGFKIIGIEEMPESYQTRLKLRQFGITVSDGHY